MKNRVKIMLLMSIVIVALSAIPTVSIYAAPKKTENKVEYKLKNGVLTIKGKGKMPKKMTFTNNKKIKKVIIKKGVTSVSNYAFSGCKNLKEVKIANTVKKIGWHSFEGTAIKKLTVPKSVKTIGNQAFYNCNKLTTVTIPADFKINIQRGDEQVREIMSGDKIKTINFNTNFELENAIYFDGTEWNVRKKDPKFKTIEGIIYSKDGKEIVRVPNKTKELVIADGCEVFCLQSILYSEYVPDDAIYVSCMDLEKITIPKSVVKIENKKYQEGYSPDEYMKIKEINAVDNKVDTNSIMTLAGILKESNYYTSEEFNIEMLINAFGDRIKKEGSFYILDSYMLLHYDANEEVALVPEGIEEIATRAFATDYIYQERKTNKIVLPEGLKKIGKEAFYECYKITEINIPNTVESIGDRAFYYTGITKIEIPESVAKWGKDVFDSSKLKGATLPNNMTVIPRGLFLNCYELEKVNVPEKLTTVKAYAFAATNVDVKSFLNNQNLSIVGNSAFVGTKWTDITIPSHIKEIGSGAFTTYMTTNVKISVEGETDNYAQDAFSAYLYSDDNNETLYFKSGVENYYTNIEIMSFGDSSKKKNKQEVEFIWTKVKGIDGYDIRVSSNKKFTNNVKKVTGTKGKTAMTVYVDKKIKNIYVKIRPYKLVNGKKVYGRWATAKM